MNSRNAAVIQQNAQPITGTCYATRAGTPLTGALGAVGDGFIYEVVDPPLKGSLSLMCTHGEFKYTPTRMDVRGMDRFTYSVRDGKNSCSNEAAVYIFIDGSLRIMPLGDSITVGSYTVDAPLPGQHVGYRRKLYDHLVAASEHRFGVEFVGGLAEGTLADPPARDPRHEGWGGFSAAQVADNVISWLTGNPPDVILLHIGTNFFDTSPADIERILDNIGRWEAENYPVYTFIARIIQTADGSLDVDTFNNNVAAMVAARGNQRLYMVDQQTGAGLDYRIGFDMFDNLHPNQSGYDKMAAKWKTDLLNAALLPIPASNGRNNS